MTLAKLEKIINSCLNDITFIYNNKSCGITSTVNNYIPTFDVWYGDFNKTYSNVEDVLTDNIFNGKSLKDLVKIVDFDVL